MILDAHPPPPPPRPLSLAVLSSDRTPSTLDSCPARGFRTRLHRTCIPQKTKFEICNSVLCHAEAEQETSGNMAEHELHSPEPRRPSLCDIHAWDLGPSPGPRCEGRGTAHQMGTTLPWTCVYTCLMLNDAVSSVQGQWAVAAFCAGGEGSFSGRSLVDDLCLSIYLQPHVGSPSPAKCCGDRSNLS